MRRIIFFLILGTLGFGLRSVAQAPLPTAFLDQLSVENGLSQSEVSCVRKDRRGYVWIGTQNGLNRYDGYRVVQYRHDPFDPQTLSNDHILTIHEDAAGRLWIGTTQGLNLYHPGTNRFRRYGSELDSLRKSKSLPVYALAHDAAGTLWVGTSRGVRHFWVGNEPDFPRLRPADAHRFLFEGQPTWLLYRDRQDRLWAGTRQGLFRQSASTPGRTAVFEYLSAQTVNALAEDAANRLWLATDEGLYRFEDGPDRLLPVSLAGLREGIAALLIDQRGLLWISTPERGVCRFRVGATGTLQPLDCIRESYFSRNGLKSGTVTCFYESTRPHEDVVWLGTKDAGAHAYSHSKNQFRHWEDMPATERAMAAHLIFSLCTDRRGQLWVGTYQGLFRIDRRTGQTRHFRPDPKRRHRLGSDKIQALYEDRRGQLWVGTDAGLFRYRPGTETFEPVRLTPDGDAEPYILRLYEDRAGTLWIGAGYGLYRLDSGGYRQVFGYDPKQAGARPAYLVSAIQEDAAGYLWLGTATGLYKMHPKTGRLTHFINNPGNPASLIGTEIYGLLLDARKRLWVCSNKGLSQLVSTPGGEQFVHIGVRDGLPNDVVYGALADRRGRLWLSTNFGLSCFDPQSRTFRNYAAADGLGRNEFNMGAFHQSPEGEFFFGGIGTLVSFDPLRMTPSRYAPPVVLTSFKTFEKTINADSLLLRHGRLTLGPDDNFFSFVFSALDYTNPERNQYAYRLEGFNDDWIYSGTRRYASFTNLPPGDYVLKVKASNADGVWNEAGILEVPLTIKPPVWRQWWFITAVLLALGGAARLFYNYRVRQRVAHLLELEKVKLAENERVRKLAAQDLHDEFGNTITRISMLTELIKTRLNGQGREVVPLLTKISDNSNRMYQGTKDFIWAINPEHDNFYEVAIRLKDFGDDIFDKTGIRFEVEGLHEHLRPGTLPMGASRHIVFLFKEAMSNTLKHAHATETRLRFARAGSCLRAEWEDNGTGFEPPQAGRGNGLTNMEQRARKIGGRVVVSSLPRVGTRITFELDSPPADVPQSG